MRASTKSGNKLVLFSVISCRAIENSLSQLAWEAGMARYFLANAPKK